MNQQSRPNTLAKSRSHVLVKISVLSAIGFVAPIILLLPLEYVLTSELGTHPSWQTIFERYSPPCVGCSLFFLAAAITSSTRRPVVTFVQSLFLLFVTFFLVGIFALAPTGHVKSTATRTGLAGYAPIAAVLLMFLVLFAWGSIGSVPTASAKSNEGPDEDTSALDR